MPVEVVTGNHAAGYALAAAGEANRSARGAACGIYPITPQTEIVERVAAFPFSKGRVVAVESAEVAGAGALVPRAGALERPRRRLRVHELLHHAHRRRRSGYTFSRFRHYEEEKRGNKR